MALIGCISLPAHSATDADLADIRAQIRQLREQYEARIQALEARLKEAEARAAAPAAEPPPVPAPAPVAASAPGGNPAAFNPAMSAILTGTYAHLSRDPAGFSLSGFAPGGEIGPGRKGFSLGESELQISANVDPHFAGNVIFAVTPDNEIAVEEAYGQWVTAPFGANLKFGRFLSGIGYLNEQHPHAWDFADAPLAYQAFLGGRYANDGLQARWIAPIEQFVEIGGEIGNGSNFPGTERSTNGAGSGALFVHTGGDIGESQSWRAGLSWLGTRAQDRPWDRVDANGDPVSLAFSGKSDVAIADFTWKWAPNGNARERNAKLQGEYLYRKERGQVATNTPYGEVDYRSRQSGWYLQGVYQWHPEWRAGVRFDRLDPGSVDYGPATALLDTGGYRPKRASVMVDYNPSEFSRFRLQLARSETVAGMADNELFVQYILSLGAHGAHKY